MNMSSSKANGHKLVILSRSFATASDAPYRYLDEAGITYEVHRNVEPENTRLIAEYIADADAVITGADVIDRYVLDSCPNLRVISKHGVGLDSIDLDLAGERGVKVCCTPKANSEAVADLTVMFMLTLQRQLRANLITTATPQWGAKKLAGDLFGSTVGLVGYGSIGSAVARRLSGFGVEILVYDPYIDPASLTSPRTHLAGLGELLESSDIVSLHLPLTESTDKIIDRSAIEKMKDGAMIINTSRGGTLEYNALYDALTSGKLAGAGLDVYPTEPPVNEPLLELANVVATPHIAAHTRQANLSMGMAAAENIVSFFAEYDRAQASLNT